MDNQNKCVEEKGAHLPPESETNATNVTKKGAQKKKRSHHKKRKRGGQPHNKNAVGFGAPYGNHNAMTHGLYQKWYFYIPPTPENKLVFAAMEKDGIDMNVFGMHFLFNNYKKMLKPQIRELQKQLAEKKKGKKKVEKLTSNY